MNSLRNLCSARGQRRYSLVLRLSRRLHVLLSPFPFRICSSARVPTPLFHLVGKLSRTDFLGWSCHLADDLLHDHENFADASFDWWRKFLNPVAEPFCNCHSRESIWVAEPREKTRRYRHVLDSIQNLLSIDFHDYSLLSLDWAGARPHFLLS